ncbi:MAG: hypothetical protein IPF73_17350 [Betaproteobacteria bacterium]|nr:hypothetical protein [Betaproteobacteria bacterium]
MSYANPEGLISGPMRSSPPLRREARADYGVPIAGLKAPDARTLQIRLTRPDLTFVYDLAYAGWSAVPCEVVEAESAEFARRPIGSGPYPRRALPAGNAVKPVSNPSSNGFLPRARVPARARRPGAADDAERARLPSTASR